MPSQVNELLHDELEQYFKDAGSCLVLSFNKLTVEQVTGLRNQFREAGMSYKVVKNRLAARAAKHTLDVDISGAFAGKCGVVFAPEEGAISAAKIVRDIKPTKKGDAPPVVVTGGVIEGAVITGPAAALIADMPDRQTVRAMLASVVSAPARSLATALNAVSGGVARCVQAKIDKEG